MTNRFGAALFRFRGLFWTLFFLGFLFFARPTVFTLACGSVFVIFGQLWRIWAAGCIGHYRGEQVGAEKLTTWGPYALSRNPLYFGNFFMGLGWAMMGRNVLLVLLLVGGFALLYVPIIKHEEAFLAAKFGEDYEHYRKQVPSFFPDLKGLPDVHSGPYDRWVIARSEIHTLWQTVVISLLLISRLWW